jgi:hypothetical protein
MAASRATTSMIVIRTTIVPSLLSGVVERTTISAHTTSGMRIAAGWRRRPRDGGRFSRGGCEGS